MSHIDVPVLFNEIGKFIRGDVQDLTEFSGDKIATLRLADSEIRDRVPTANVDQLLFDIAVHPRTPKHRERAAEALGWIAEWLPEDRIHHWLDLTLRASSDKHSFAYGLFHTLPGGVSDKEDPLCLMLDRLGYYEHPKKSHGLLVSLFSKSENFEKEWYQSATIRLFESETKNPGSQLNNAALQEFQNTERTRQILGLALKTGLKATAFLQDGMSEMLKKDIQDIQKAHDLKNEAMGVLGEIYTQQITIQKNML